MSLKSIAERLKSLVRVTRDAAKTPEVSRRLKQVEKAIQLNNLGVAQADVDQKVSLAAAALIGALEHTESAAIQLHSLIIVKTRTGTGGSKIVVRTLTIEQLIHLESHPALIGDPESLLRWSVDSSTGTATPLSSLMDEDVVDGPPEPKPIAAL